MIRSKTHDMVCQWVAQSRNAKELTKLEAKSLAMLATELAAVNTVETHSAAPSLALVNFTAKRAPGEFWNLSQQADQPELVELQHKERPDILIFSPPRGDFQLASHFSAFCRRWRMKTC